MSSQNQNQASLKIQRRPWSFYLHGQLLGPSPGSNPSMPSEKQAALDRDLTFYIEQNPMSRAILECLREDSKANLPALLQTHGEAPLSNGDFQVWTYLLSEQEVNNGVLLRLNMRESPL